MISKIEIVFFMGAAAMEVLFLIGFSEEIIIEMGKAESYLVLKRNDPGLLWLAKSSLEANLVK